MPALQAIHVRIGTIEQPTRASGMLSFDTEGLIPPTWDAVINQDYEPWDWPHLMLHTWFGTIENSLAERRSALEVGDCP
jgi:hypothetical protein